MTVLHVISSGGMYGAEAVILNLSRTLNRDGHKSLLGIFSNSANPNLQLHECALSESIESHLIPCSGQADTGVPARIRALSASAGADIVHAHGYKADVYCYLALRRSAIALVSTCHNWLDDGQLVRIYGALDRRVLRRYAAVIAVSEEVKQRLVRSGVAPAKIALIRNGIDLRPFEAARPSLRDFAPEPDALLVGWIGRLSPEKGPDLFVRAAAQMHAELPGARFILVGEGPQRPELERLIGDLGLPEIVQLAGRRSDMPAVYASFDLMISSSRREGLPMAILEGMASRLPWVATSVGDVPTLVQDGHTGLLAAPEDVPGLATSAARLLKSTAERLRMGAAAQDLVEREHSAARMSAEYLTVYRSVRAAKGPERESGIEHAASRQRQ